MSANTSTQTELFDAQGFLVDPELWNRDLALGIAAELQLSDLEDAHWRVIDHLRERYLDTGALPVQQTLCRELDLVDGCVAALFGGPLEAWKVAGLPFPGEEARAYMGNMEPDEAAVSHDQTNA